MMYIQNIMHSDKRYIDALLNNDEKVLNELYRECFPLVVKMVVHNNGTETIAADLFQEALVEVFRKAKEGRLHLQTSLFAYIIAISKHKWFDLVKKQRQLQVTFTGFDPQDHGEDSFIVSEQFRSKQAKLDLIRSKFLELGERCKEILNLSWSLNTEGRKRSTEELAAILGVTNGYLRKKKSECIVKLIKLVIADPEYKRLKQ